MESKESTRTSIFRLRLGVVFIFMWWLPFWIVTPAISDMLGLTPDSKHSLLIKVVIVQTVLGITGATIAGREVFGIIKHTSFKKVPKTVYVALRYGELKIG